MCRRNLPLVRVRFITRLNICPLLALQCTVSHSTAFCPPASPVKMPPCEKTVHGPKHELSIDNISEESKFIFQLFNDKISKMSEHFEELIAERDVKITALEKEIQDFKTQPKQNEEKT